MSPPARAARPRPAAPSRTLERHLAALVASCDDAIIGKTLDGTIVSWNDGAERLYGYTAAEALGQSISFIIPLEQPDELPAILDRLARGERIAHYETVRQRKDGVRIDVSVTISPLRGRGGAIIGASAIARDITARKATEAALQASEQRYRELFENAGDMLYILDLEGRFTDMNRTAEEVTGYGRAELMGRPLLDLIAPEHHALMQSVLAHGTEAGAGTTCELEIFTRDGGRVALEVTNRLVREADRPIAIQGSARDMSARRAAEAALRESEERLQLAARAAGFGTYDDRGPGRVYWSPELKALFGLPADADPDDGPRVALAAIHPEDRERWLAALEAARDPTGPGEMDVEHRVLRPDGRTLWLSQKGRILFEGEGVGRQRVRAIGVVADITARKEAEVALQASREQLTSILTSLSGGITVQGVDGRLLFANDAAARLIGFSSVDALLAQPQDAILASFQVTAEDGTLVAPEDLPNRRAMLDRTPAAAVLRYTIVASGEQRWSSVSAVPVLDRAGGLRFTVTAFQDITPLKEAESALRASEARFRAIAETANEGIWLIDLEARTIFANARMAQLLGTTVAVMAGRSVPSFCFAEDVPRARAHIARNIAGHFEQFDFRFRRDDGTPVLVLAGTSAMRDGTGMIVGALGLFSDITERERLHRQTEELAAVQAALNADLRVAVEARNSALRQAQAALRIRDEFLASISHDLRTPLAVIAGVTQSVLRQAARGSAFDRDRLTSSLKTVDASAERMARMIDDLLDLTRLESGRPPELHLQPTDLLSLARRLAHDHQRGTEAHRIAVRTELSGLDGRWDPARLERAFSNLLSNAIKYSPTGGDIILAVAQERIDGDQWARLSVIDRGLGIPAADLPHVFERFHRGGNVGSVRGVGIGLAGVKQIVEQHGGTIAVESSEGAGTTVTVRLPCDPPAHADT